MTLNSIYPKQNVYMKTTFYTTCMLKLIYASCVQVRVANLLGVVGTDVPIQQIQKLVQPYKVSDT